MFSTRCKSDSTKQMTEKKRGNVLYGRLAPKFGEANVVNIFFEEQKLGQNIMYNKTKLKCLLESVICKTIDDKNCLLKFKELGKKILIKYIK